MSLCIAYIGIGSNVGERLQFCRNAVFALASPKTTITKISSLYETDPVDYTNQAQFYNAVIEVATLYNSFALLETCQAIERQQGKNITISKGPRTVDLDILFYQDQIMDHPSLTLPHPEALKRHFVLIPMAEIAPDFIPPGSGDCIKALCPPLSSYAPHVRKLYSPEWDAIRTQYSHLKTKPSESFL